MRCVLLIFVKFHLLEEWFVYVDVDELQVKFLEELLKLSNFSLLDLRVQYNLKMRWYYMYVYFVGCQTFVLLECSSQDVTLLQDDEYGLQILLSDWVLQWTVIITHTLYINFGVSSLSCIWFFSYRCTRTGSFLLLSKPTWNFFKDSTAYITKVGSSFNKCWVVLIFFFNLLLVMAMCFLLVLSWMKTRFCFYFCVPLCLSNLSFSWSNLIFFIFLDFESTIIIVINISNTHTHDCSNIFWRLPEVVVLVLGCWSR